MVSSDTIVGIVGAVILTGAMIAVFYYEAGRDPALGTVDLGDGAQRFTYNFSNETHMESGTASLGADQSETHDVALPAYARTFHVELAWQRDPIAGLPLLPSDLIGAPSFRIEILNGTGAVVADRTADEAMANVPPQQGEFDKWTITVAGDDAEDADRAVREHMESFDGRTWTLRVTLVDDGDDTGAIGPTYTYTANIHVGYLTPLRPLA